MNFSRFEKNISIEVQAVDSLGQTLLQRIKDLLGTRTDISKEQFFRAIGRPTPSWRSEFWSGKRTINNLRLVVRIAKFFNVPVGYLLNEQGAEQDPRTVSMMGLWADLRDPLDRDAVVGLAIQLKRRQDAAAGGSTEPPAETNNRGPRNSGAKNAHPQVKRR